MKLIKTFAASLAKRTGYMSVYRVSVRLASLWSVKVCAEVSLNLPRCGRRQQIARNFAAKSSAKWQACYTYSINRAPTHAVSLSHTSPPLSPSTSSACLPSVDCLSSQDTTGRRRYKFFGFSPFGIVFAFEQTCLLTCNMLHAACGMRRIYGMPQTFI